MVCWLVEDYKVGLRYQHVCQCHAFLLSTAELPHRLIEVADMQLRENLFGFQYTLRVAVVVEACVEHTLGRVERWLLLQIAHFKVVAVYDFS